MQRSKEKKIVIRDSEAEQHLRAMREAREAAERADREAGAQSEQKHALHLDSLVLGATADNRVHQAVIGGPARDAGQGQGGQREESGSCEPTPQQGGKCKRPCEVLVDI